MQYHNKGTKTLQDVLEWAHREGLFLLAAAITRICEMASVAPAAVAAEAGMLRALVAKILPAAHGVKPKTWANILSQFRGALRLAGVIDGMSPGSPCRTPPGLRWSRP